MIEFVVVDYKKEQMIRDWNKELDNTDDKIHQRRSQNRVENQIVEHGNNNKPKITISTGTQMNNEIYIPDRFRRVVVLHVIKNLMTQSVVRVPLLLGIHGSSGDGKTYQCEKILEELGVKSFLISGGQLESHQAGEPAQLIRTAYLNAGRCMQNRESQAAVVLINDIDTGLGSWGEMVQYTINRQTVFGELMHLVDYPTSVEGRTNTKRVPIIITGNDFTKLYEPLVRAGRMTAFAWNPSLEEKIQITSRIFPEISSQECETLVKEFQTQPLAFFPHLKATLIDDELWQQVEQKGISSLLVSINNGNEPNLLPSIQFDRLLQAGRNLLQSGQLVNHLRKSFAENITTWQQHTLIQLPLQELNLSRRKFELY